MSLGKPSRDARVLWGASPIHRTIGELLTASDVCHLHEDRAAAERCGVLLGGEPDIVGLEECRPRVYRAVWSLSAAASGHLVPRRSGSEASGTLTRRVGTLRTC